MGVEIIVSGGQTGADRGGLEAGKHLGLITGGWAARDYRVDGGRDPELGTIFGLREHTSSEYPPRTAANVKFADATVFLGRRSPGWQCTNSACRRYGKEWLWLRDELPVELAAEQLLDWLRLYRVRILNVAGNRERKNPGIRVRTVAVLLEALE
jgi:hypothetical protein